VLQFQFNMMKCVYIVMDLVVLSKIFLYKVVGRITCVYIVMGLFVVRLFF